MKNPGVVAMIAESDLMAPHLGFFYTLQVYDKSAESEELEILDHFQDQFLAHLRALSVPLPTSGFPQGWPRGLQSGMERPSSSPARPTTRRPAQPDLSLPEARGRQVSKAARREGVAPGPERLPSRHDDDKATTEGLCLVAANAGGCRVGVRSIARLACSPSEGCLQA